jgi:preprotein translocase subunit SecE
MARIQKKKPAAQKKKTKPQATGREPEKAAENTAPAAASAEPAPAAGGDAAREKKQKGAASTRKSPAAGQSAVLRLVDRYFGHWIQFLREVRIELGKVTWPSRKQTIGSTVVVLVFVFVIALFLGVIDIGLSSLVRLIL